MRLISIAFAVQAFLGFGAAAVAQAPASAPEKVALECERSEERRVGKEC